MQKIDNSKLPQYFKDFVLALNEFNVEYILIGGYALGVYGHIRATGDLDIFINATKKNAKKIKNACIRFGIPIDQITDEMFLVPKMVRIGDLPFRIEILKKLDNVDFQYVFDRKVVAKVDGVLINAISLDDLIILKKAAIKDRSVARDKEDLNYLEDLKKKQKG